MSVAQNRVVVDLLLSEIYPDSEFNSRGEFNPIDCVPLANDIKKSGLQTPISVQPYDKKPGYKYRILAGHRRFTAFQINSEPLIPAFIIHGLDDLGARDYNIKENIFRENLTFLQEAKALQPYFKANLSDKQVADRLNRSPGWSMARRQLLELPEDIQSAAGQEIINQGHVKSLFLLRHNKEKMYDVFKGIKEAKERGEKIVRIKKDKDIIDMTALRRPQPHDLALILDIITPMLVHSTGKENFGAKCLAFCYGTISEAELWLGAKNEAERIGVPFNPPKEIRDILGF